MGSVLYFSYFWFILQFIIFDLIKNILIFNSLIVIRFIRNISPFNQIFGILFKGILINILLLLISYLIIIIEDKQLLNKIELEPKYLIKKISNFLIYFFERGFL